MEASEGALTCPKMGGGGGAGRCRCFGRGPDDAGAHLKRVDMANASPFPDRPAAVAPDVGASVRPRREIRG